MTEQSLRVEWEAARQLIFAHAHVVAKERSLIPTWRAAASFIQHHAVMIKAESQLLDQLYKESKRVLLPLSDPLDCPFPVYQRGFFSREEVYSDWLQWVLEQVQDVRFIGRILGSSNLMRLPKSKEPIRVNREVCVKHGNIDHTGRLDLVVEQGSRCLAVIEVKTRPFVDADLYKHDGYQRAFVDVDLQEQDGNWESIQKPEIEWIFIAVDSLDSDLRGFRFLSWAAVCVALRGITPYMLDQEHILSTALILAFVGAVEQNLLGFVSPPSALTAVGRIPRMVDHLTKARMEASLGNPTTSSE